MILTDETIAQIADEIQLGMTRQHAAALAGLDWGTVKRWLLKGSEYIQTISEGHSLTTELQVMCAKLTSSVEMAEAVYTKGQMTMIHAEAAPALRLKMLQLRFPELYGEVRRTEVTVGTVEGTASIEETMSQLGIPYE